MLHKGGGIPEAKDSALRLLINYFPEWLANIHLTA
jgi:hypothetical protein